jgi:VWFA-related protein
MRKSFILFLIAGTATSISAQSLTEKIDVSLVNVDVTVTSHGAPARGLTRDDFQIFEDGVPRPITNFYSVEPPSPGARNVQTAPATAAPTVIADPADERFRRKVLVIVDNRHVTMHNRDRALAALERFVDDRFTGGTYDWSIALVSDKAHVMLPLTSDKEKLHETVAAIRRIAANPGRPAQEDVMRLTTVDNFVAGNSVASGGSRAALQDMADLSVRAQMKADATHTVDAIRDAVRSFAGAPGRKIILLVTGSLGFDDTGSPFAASAQSAISGPASVAGAARFATVMRDVLIHEANASNVSFYIVNSEGLTDSGGSDATAGSGELGFASSIGRGFTGGSSNQLAAMYWLARETGGRLMPGNSPEKSLAEFDRASSTFYSLAYKPAHGDDGKYHSIKVRVNHSGYQLQYRTGYSSVPVRVQLARAMQSPFAATMQQSSIPIDIITGNSTPSGAAGTVAVPLQATVPAKNLQFVPTENGSIARVDLYVSVFDERGRRISGNQLTREAHADNGTETAGNFVESRQLVLRRGIPYRVVVAVHDQVTDAIGIASKTVRF